MTDSLRNLAGDAMDHIQRLYDRCYEDADKVTDLKYIEDTESDRKKVANEFVALVKEFENNNWSAAIERADELAKYVAKRKEQLRHSIMEHVADNDISVASGDAPLDAVRWLARINSHVERLSHYLGATAENKESSIKQKN